MRSLPKLMLHNSWTGTEQVLLWFYNEGVIPAFLTAASNRQVASAARKNLVAAIDQTDGTEGVH